MNSEVIRGIIAGAGSLVTVVGAIKSAVIIKPSEIGVIKNRFTGEMRPLLDQDRTIRARVIKKGVNVPVVRIPSSDGSETMRPATTRELQENGRAAFTRVSVDMLIDDQIPAPKQGLVFRIPVVEQINTDLPTTQFIYDPKEDGLQVPIKYEGLRVLGTPDIQISFRIRPDHADDIHRRFPTTKNNHEPTLSQFLRAIQSLGLAAAYHTISDRDFDDLSNPKNIGEIGQTAQDVFKQLLIQRGIDHLLIMGDVTFQRVSLGEIVEEINEIAAQNLRRRALGELFGSIQTAEILAKGQNITVVVPQGADGLLGLMARTVGSQKNN